MRKCLFLESLESAIAKQEADKNVDYLKLAEEALEECLKVITEHKNYAEVDLAIRAIPELLNTIKILR